MSSKRILEEALRVLGFQFGEDNFFLSGLAFSFFHHIFGEWLVLSNMAHLSFSNTSMAFREVSSMNVVKVLTVFFDLHLKEM